MSRLDRDRQNKLEPVRLDAALTKIKAAGLEIIRVDDKKVVFEFKGAEIQYFAYSGWATGKTIKDGRGLNKLLNQLNKI